MATIAGAPISMQARPRFPQPSLVMRGNHSLKTAVSFWRTSVPRLQSVPLRLRVSCSQAKPETVEKVCSIVRKQLALPNDSAVTGESKFSALGADSLDTVEIVMGLEEEFGISVEEESAQSITTVQEAADLIEKLIEKQKA
ncbi:acyl carrier protein [Ancistrocladus abbreviatus]